MKQFSKDTTTILVLEKGEELIQKLTNYAREQDLQGGWINVIGGASRVTLGFYDPDTKEYAWQDFTESLEIVGLQGNLSFIDNEPFWHIHGIFSRRDFTTIAGHVKSCLIGLTGEVHLIPHPQKLVRFYDEETGLKLLAADE